jgi:hypothetical protein
MLALQRPLRGFRLALALSLGFNLFAAAFVGEIGWRHWGQGRVASLVDDSNDASPLRGILRQILETLPPEDAALVREAFAARLPELMMLRRQSVQATEKVRSDIAQSHFDIDRTRADMGASREARQKMAVVIQDTLLKVLPDMSDAGRSKLATYHVLPASRN